MGLKRIIGRDTSGFSRGRPAGSSPLLPGPSAWAAAALSSSLLTPCPTTWLCSGLGRRSPTTGRSLSSEAGKVSPVLPPVGPPEAPEAGHRAGLQESHETGTSEAFFPSILTFSCSSPRELWRDPGTQQHGGGLQHGGLDRLSGQSLAVTQEVVLMGLTLLLCHMGIITPGNGVLRVVLVCFMWTMLCLGCILRSINRQYCGCYCPGKFLVGAGHGKFPGRAVTLAQPCPVLSKSLDHST